jgi:hypothetical protein
LPLCLRKRWREKTEIQAAARAALRSKKKLQQKSTRLLRQGTQLAAEPTAPAAHVHRMHNHSELFNKLSSKLFSELCSELFSKLFSKLSSELYIQLNSEVHK